MEYFKIVIKRPPFKDIVDPAQGEVVDRATGDLLGYEPESWTVEEIEVV